MFIAVLAFFGLAAGSFVNALVWRLHEQAKAHKAKDLSILKGRSMCPKCNHQLAVKDLIPVFSWLALHGRCRYCKKPISLQYPLAELTMAVVFILSYIWWSGDLNLSGQRLLFGVWLVSAVGLLALLIYDLKWMLLPSRLIYPTLAVTLAGRLGYIVFFSNHSIHDLELLVLSLAVASGLFWVLFQLSDGKWIGYGDVRLGLITGTLLATPALSMLMIFLASVLGLVATGAGLLGGKLSFGRKIPYGPFLIAATGITLLFGQSLIDWYQKLLM